MLVSLTPAQKIIVALSSLALVAGLWIGSGAGRHDRSADEAEQVTYTLSDSDRVPITVHVVGEVRRPGLYTLPAGSRVLDAVQAAGGFTDRSRQESVNLAAFLDDGEQISVGAKAPVDPPADAPVAPAAARSPEPQPDPPAERVERHLPSPSRPRAAPAPVTEGGTPGGDLPEFAQGQASPRVRLNSAGLEELQSIPGIGPELAKRIIYHRSVNGPFGSFSDLDEVPGIGPATIEKIRVSATLN